MFVFDAISFRVADRDPKMFHYADNLITRTDKTNQFQYQKLSILYIKTSPTLVITKIKTRIGMRKSHRSHPVNPTNNNNKKKKTPNCINCNSRMKGLQTHKCFLCSLEVRKHDER